MAQDEDWTEAQIKTLVELQKEATTMPHKKFAQLFNEKCKSKHTKAGIVQMISFLQEENTITEKGVQWNEEQVNVLKDIYKEKINFKQVVQRFQKLYPQFTYEQIALKTSFMIQDKEMKAKSKNQWYAWSEEDVQKLIAMWNRDSSVPMPEVVNEFCKQNKDYVQKQVKMKIWQLVKENKIQNRGKATEEEQQEK